MNGTENLRSELLRQSGGGTAAPGLDHILRRERWKVRAWAVAAAVLWIAAAAYLLVLLWVYTMMIHPVIHEFFTGDYTRPDAAGALQPRMFVIARLLLAALYWPALLALAAVCTVLFTLASRRATLRQIQAHLADISAQLRALATQA